MKQRDLNDFKKLLDERRQELMSEAVGTMHGMGLVADSRETFPDPTDRASLEGNRNLTLRIRDRERKLITKIDEALGRIADGSYGVCEECGGALGVAGFKRLTDAQGGNPGHECDGNRDRRREQNEEFGTQAHGFADSFCGAIQTEFKGSPPSRGWTQLRMRGASANDRET
jgi:DnaK suppressor protein